MRGFQSIEQLSNRICINDYTSNGTKLSLQHSLNRLGLQSVDTLRIHDPNDNSNNNRHRTCNNNHHHDGDSTSSSSSSSSPFVDEVLQVLDKSNGMLNELQRMKHEGIINHIGIGMNNINNEDHIGSTYDILRLLKGAGGAPYIDSALLAGGWNFIKSIRI